jgi:hypothetical protein
MLRYTPLPSLATPLEPSFSLAVTCACPDCECGAPVWDEGDVCDNCELRGQHYEEPTACPTHKAGCPRTGCDV